MTVEEAFLAGADPIVAGRPAQRAAAEISFGWG